MEQNKARSIEFRWNVLEGIEIKYGSMTNQSYKKHLHQELSIGLIEKGATFVSFGSDEHYFEQGEGIIIPPLMSHICSPLNCDEWQFTMLYIDPQYYRDKINFAKIAKVKEDCVEKIRRFTELLQADTEGMSIEEALIDLLLELEKSTQESQMFLEQSIDMPIVAEVADFLENHYSEVSLQFLEKQFNINKFTLIRQFKKVYNTTPSAYKLQLKVAESKKYLKEGMDVLTVCEKLGFYDQAHFIREFKKMNGISPSMYLKKANAYKR